MAAALGGALARDQTEQMLGRATEFDQAVGGLAASLIHVPLDTIDAQIVQTLGTVAELLEADQATVIQCLPDERMMTRTHLWVRPGTPDPPVTDPRDAFPGCWPGYSMRENSSLSRGLTTCRPRPPTTERPSPLRRPSCALAPMVVQDRVVGILSFATVTGERCWLPDLMPRLRLVGEIIASALARRDAEVALRAALVENERLRERLEAENVYLKAELSEARDFGEIVGRSAALRGRWRESVKWPTPTRPVLLLGETGTGKELLARGLHTHGPRRDRPFIAVNCAALPDALIESELFGYEKGAFTGATQAKPGRFELADRGTLLLDEIGDLAPALQTKLLRVLEDGELQRLGATVTRKVDVRVIAATNRNLQRGPARRSVPGGPLLPVGRLPHRGSAPPAAPGRHSPARLALHPIAQPGAQPNDHEDPQDRDGRTPGVRLARERPRAAERHRAGHDPLAWIGPQNRRCLRARTGGRGEAGRRSSAESLQDVERAHIVRLLNSCGWTIEGRGQAAERLGLNPSTLRNRMRKLGIRRPAQ